MEYKLDARGQGVRSMDEIQSQLNALQSQKYIALNIFSIVYHLETINCVHPINLTRYRSSHLIEVFGVENKFLYYRCISDRLTVSIIDVFLIYLLNDFLFLFFFICFFGCQGELEYGFREAKG